MREYKLWLSSGLNLEKQSGLLPSTMFCERTVPHILRRENKSLPAFSRVFQQCPPLVTQNGHLSLKERVRTDMTFSKSIFCWKADSKNTSQNGSTQFKRISRHCINNLAAQRGFDITSYQQISKKMKHLTLWTLYLLFRFCPNGKKK